MSNKLKDELIKAFSGKMENKQAFIMQFVMNTAQQGNPPPQKEDIEKAISKLIQDRTFREKGNLLILNMKSPQITSFEEEKELPEKSPIKNTESFSKFQILVLEAFQGSFENKSALLMNVTMNEVSKGNTPPSKDELETAITELIQEGVLKSKDSMLIKIVR